MMQYIDKNNGTWEPCGCEGGSEADTWHNMETREHLTLDELKTNADFAPLRQQEVF